VGVGLAPLVKAFKIKLSTLSNKVIVFDANNMLYQFLALVRMGDGTLFKDRSGRVTSHLLGSSLRISRLMAEYHVKPVMVFDGAPNILKMKTLEERRAQRARALREWEEELKRGNLRRAFSKAVVSATLRRDLVEDAVEMFKLMGVPVIFAPEDAEAQAAYICSRGDAWAVATQDYDALLYGSPRVVRYVTIHGVDFLPSKMMLKPLVPEMVVLEENLKALGLTREKLVDVAILSGTDFNRGVPNVGPKKAYKLIKMYGCIEGIPFDEVKRAVEGFDEVRRIFLSPRVTAEYSIAFSEPEVDRLTEFFRERDFSEKNIDKVVERLKRFHAYLKGPTLKEWL